MRSTIDGAGRVVVPKALRDRLHLSGGGAVDIVERDGVIEIAPVALEVEVRSTPEGAVGHATADVPVLTDDDVRATVESLRR